MLAVRAWPPHCPACGGPLRELGDEQVRTFPAVFAVAYWCGACAVITGRIDDASGWHS